jgi:4-hydroxy-2-oxoheptanedioate aldolase
MELIPNDFKIALADRRPQLGLWCSLADPVAAELVAGSGFDWLLFDMEHTRAEVRDVLSQMQAVAPYPVSPVVRPPANDRVVIKRLLDIGTQTLLIPQVNTAEEARAAVAATRYPPAGVRGVAGLTRATRFGRVADYQRRAAQQLCVLVQLESAQALGQLEEIAAVDGVDGCFVGPSDLAASLGYPEGATHPDVTRAVGETIQRIQRAGKPAGVLTTDPVFASRCIELGTTFTAVGMDTHILARTSEQLARQFRSRQRAITTPLEAS